jgi:hypothetical protein
VFSLFIAISWEPGIVPKEQIRAIVWIGIAEVCRKMERTGADIVEMSD